MNGYAVKDSGKRMQFSSGMVRDTNEGKSDPSLVRDGPMYKRWIAHLTKGAVKYAKRNWMQAEGQAELDRFKESAARHFEQWYDGETDEDHAAAVFFNINGAEYVKEKLNPQINSFEDAVSAAMAESVADTLDNPNCAWCLSNLDEGYTVEEANHRHAMMEGGRIVPQVDPTCIPCQKMLARGDSRHSVAVAHDTFAAKKRLV